MSPGIRLSALLSAVLLASAGCGDGSAPDEAPDAEPAPTSSAPTSSAPLPTTTSAPTPTRTRTPPSEALEKVRVVGEVTSTGECVVVRDDNGITWTLVGEPTRDLEVGDRVRATGAPDLGATGCGGPVVRTTRITATD